MNNTDRDALRARMRALRRGLSEEEQEAAAQAVFRRLSCWTPYRQARTVMAYVACRGELSLEAVIRDIPARGRRLVLPRCEAPGIMTARQVRCAQDLVPGRFGLLEPSDGCGVVAPQEIDLILTPGTAFDRLGGRLGQGGGYYDRFLPQTHALRAGVCHDAALLDAVPTLAHDARMDVVFTPGGAVCCREVRNQEKHGRT